MKNNKDDNKNDKPEVKRFHPLVVKGTEIDDKGVTKGDERLMKIEIPLEEDVNTINDAVNKNKSISRTTSKRNIEGEPDMDEKEVQNIIRKTLESSKTDDSINKMAKTSDDLVKNTNDIKTKMSDFSDRMNALNDLVNSNMLKTNNFMKGLNDKQSESCVGVDCLKDNISSMNDGIEDLKSSSKMATCSGENGCNAQIPIGSSFCPNCGKKIMKWTGRPDWKNYTDRSK